jgi:hypothetical protein
VEGVLAGENTVVATGLSDDEGKRPPGDPGGQVEDRVADAGTPPCGGKRFPSTCRCGQPLPRRATGRSRRTCSLRCSRERDAIIRRLRRRIEWIGAWREEEGRRNFTRERIRTELRTLVAEADALREALGLPGRGNS